MIRDGEVADVAALTRRAQELLQGARTCRRTCASASPTSRSSCVSSTCRRSRTTSERDAAVRFQAAEAIAMPLDEVDPRPPGDRRDAEPRRRRRQRVVVVAAREVDDRPHHRGRQGRRPQGRGRRPRRLRAGPHARHRVAAPDDSARVYCHLAGITNLAIAVGSSCLFTRPLSTTWDEQDETGRQRAGRGDPPVDRLLHGAARGALCGEVVLSGPGSRATASSRASALLGLPVRVAEPLGGLDAVRPSRGEDPYRHTVAAGLALGAAA